MSPRELRTQILVVEDEPAIRTIVAEKLRQAGYDVTTAPNGEEGLRMASELLPAAVVTDFEMPLRDGLSMSRALFAHEPTALVPVILLTARGHRLRPEELADTGIRQVVMKPFSVRDLLAAVSDCVPPADLARAA